LDNQGTQDGILTENADLESRTINSKAIAQNKDLVQDLNSLESNDIKRKCKFYQPKTLKFLFIGYQKPVNYNSISQGNNFLSIPKPIS
jgi:hypothetical protein